MTRRLPARTASSRMAIRHKFDRANPFPILGDLVREKRGKATRQQAGLEAGVGGHVILDIENHYSALADEIELLCRWVGVSPDNVQTPPPIVMRSFGRPTKDGASIQPILDDILEWVSNGKPLAKYESLRFQVDSRRAKMLVTKYLRTSKDFAAAYAVAKAIGTHHLVDETIAIADDSNIATGQAANMIKARQWAAAKLNPTVYGNNSESNVNVNVGFGDALEQLEKRRNQNTLAAPSHRLEVIDIEPLPLQRADEKEGSVAALASD
jgi:hypothetical protein